MTTGAFFIIIFACFFVALFCLFRLGRDDVILIRKNVSMEQLFNLAFLSGFTGILVGWFGNTLAGGISAGMLFLIVLTRRNKLPTGRIADFFSVAFLCVIPFAFFLLYFFQRQHEVIYIVSAIFSFFLFLFFLIILLPKALRADMKDGSLTLLFLINITLLLIFISVFRQVYGNFPFSLEDGLFVFVFVSSCFLLVRQEKKSLLRYIKR